MVKHSNEQTARTGPLLQKKLLDRMTRPHMTEAVVLKLIEEEPGAKKTGKPETGKPEIRKPETGKTETERITQLETELDEAKRRLAKAQDRLAFQAKYIQELKEVLRLEGKNSEAGKEGKAESFWRMIPVVVLTGAAVLLAEHGLGVIRLFGLL